MAAGVGEPRVGDQAGLGWNLSGWWDICLVMLEYTDRELWEGASGSEAAFGVLFERHVNTVYNFCFRRTGNWAAAEDLAAAVFLEAWRRRDEVALTHDSSRPWLLGVANNLLRNHWRSNRRRAAALDRVKLERDPPTPGELSVELRRDEEDMRKLLAVVDRLPQKQREVLVLCSWSGLTYDEAAVALSVPVGTVRSRLSRAKARVAELFREPGHEQVTERDLARPLVPEPRKAEL